MLGENLDFLKTPYYRVVKFKENPPASSEAHSKLVSSPPLGEGTQPPVRLSPWRGILFKFDYPVEVHLIENTL